MMNSRMLLRPTVMLSTLVLLGSFAATAVATEASAKDDSLTCKLGNPETVITNNSSGTLPAGTKIVVRYYPTVGAMKQRFFSLESDVAPGENASVKGEALGYYRTCTARVRA